MWEILRDAGYITLGKHEGWYCTTDETFLTDTQIEKNPDESGGSTAFCMVVDWCANICGCCLAATATMLLLLRIYLTCCRHTELQRILFAATVDACKCG
jgi:methionyl-tRNA synthetase